MEGGRSQAAAFGKGCPWARPLGAGSVSAARRNSGAHLEMAQRQRGSPKPFCGIEETKLDSEKRSGTFSCVPVRLCVCSPGHRLVECFLLYTCKTEPPAAVATASNAKA